MSEFNVGDKVKFLSQAYHDGTPQWYPPVGTVGTVLEVDEEDLLVDWGDTEGITVSDDGKKAWWCFKEHVKKLPIAEIPKVTDAEAYTNDEVWEMLKPKMCQYIHPYYNIDNFSQEIKSMIVSAYRSGYGRAVKGRSFMISEKKSKKANDVTIYVALRRRTLVDLWENRDILVSRFTKVETDDQSKNFRIYGQYVYSNEDIFHEGEEGFNYLYSSDPDAKTYVAVTLKDGIKMGGFKYMLLSDIFSSGYRYGIGKVVSVDNNTVTYCDIFTDERYCVNISDLRNSALIPIHAYLKYKGVNV